jgi:hypothetical protein
LAEQQSIKKSKLWKRRMTQTFLISKRFGSKETIEALLAIDWKGQWIHRKK